MNVAASGRLRFIEQRANEVSVPVGIGLMREQYRRSLATLVVKV
jgi:hypothetical protein